jgi:hypothetical protein
MRKNFVVVLPDEPYKTTTNLNKTVECTYIGPRYLSLCVITQTGDIKYVGRKGETVDELEISTLVDDQEGTSFHVLDAELNPFEAAYLTNLYEHGDVPDFTAMHPGDLGSWTYHYDDGTGVIGQCFYGQDIKYINGSYTKPRYREHASTREAFLKSCIDVADVIENSLKSNDYTAEDRKTLEDYVVWSRSVPVKYANIDHWKIPFPKELPRYF